ncbi:MAG: hypothetical protein IT445_02170 [Phycisphaeraceae bacterium]|nr:hypothetical protein [Phycisphaeraceae bacterium]
MKTPRSVKLRTYKGEPSWTLSSDRVLALVTRDGGHLGPVTFDRKGKAIEPFSVAPWGGTKMALKQPAILRVLRGDFFCAPFGGNSQPYRGEQHPLHGQAANEPWTFRSLQRDPDRSTLHLSLKTTVRRGQIDKKITLIDGHDALYVQHVFSKTSGPMCFGHHPMLKLPDTPGSGLLSFSKWTLGQTYHDPVENPQQGGYSMFKPGAVFKRLDRVPMIDGTTTDVSCYPARRGFEDAVQLMADPKLKLAWSALSVPSQGYVWFSLRDPKVLTGTVLWLSNGGRYYEPWCGRHINVIGIEDVTGYFFDGIAASSKPNPHTKRGYVTALKLSPRKKLAVNYIMAVAKVSKRFGRVNAITPAPGSAGGVTLTGEQGAKVNVPLEVDFLGSAG